MKFTKMHGFGNDYIYVNLFEERIENESKAAVILSDRHFGIGSDGLVLIAPSKTADLKMIMYNADGSRGKMCGNAVRCIGKYAYERNLCRKEQMTLETDSGIKTLTLEVDNGMVNEISVDMGIPDFRTENVPYSGCGNGQIQTLQIDERIYMFVPVSIGNPHAVVFLDDDDINTFPVEEIGRRIGESACFPEQANVEFVKVLDPQTIRMRVRERGSGVTLACGTGACAAMAVCVMCGKTQKTAQIILDGGTLTITWRDSDNHLVMRGPAAYVCDGETHIHENK